MSSRIGVIQEHTRILRQLSLLSYALTALLAYLASYLPLFDSSPRTIINGASRSWTSTFAYPLLRWDVFHYGHTAQYGYVYEHQWAFFPGPSLVMRGTSEFLHFLGVISQRSTWETVLVGGAVIASLCDTSTTLYHLSLHHLRSPSLAFLATLLSLLPSSPATLRLVPYSEPYFTMLSYRGMLYCARRQWLAAVCAFALAGAFRSNGVMLAGFVLWGIVVEPSLHKQQISPGKVIHALALTLIATFPFIYHQYRAYIAFCTDVTSAAPWCESFPPSIYTYVQARYWGVGFLRYWTLPQLPNFLLAAPVLAVLLWSTTYYVLHALNPRLRAVLSGKDFGASAADPSPFLGSSLAPHALHALIFTLLLLLNSHTQIVLRLAASMPFTYWTAARLVMESPRWGRWWVAWSVVWGAISVILWAVFLPPA
ncbi:glycosyltransferase family 76 protein [Gelatoporia subvermispora B]|uniref:GPI mannosyltransferase 2 n=1 Tax=Ceriporiopsis subvermispora (strain B) TaxID=914234 RepID=M2Q5N3_CERS8|nr:glycosyltransferase family 76 protein [Gelatoporia subvermispora B]